MTCWTRSRTSSTLARFLLALLALAFSFGPTCAHLTQLPLPIYIEDNHAGTFHFLASTLDLDRPHVLVLIDAHSDSGEPAGVAALRDGIRRVKDTGELEARLTSWRREGRVQSFDWIAPLMPRPLERVLWVGPPSVNSSRRVAESPLDSEKTLRALGPRYAMVGLEELGERLPPGLPVVVSIDLDFFSGLPEAKRKDLFKKVWHAVIGLPRLSALSFALSRPWVADDAEASELLMLALEASLSVADADLRFEPYGIEGPDRSEKAKEFYRERREPHRLDLDRMFPDLRSLLLANEDRFTVRLDPARWQETRDRWRRENSVWRIHVAGVDEGADGVIRPAQSSASDLRVDGGPPGDIQRVTWLMWTPTSFCYNVLPELPAGKTFTGTAPPVVSYRAGVLAHTESAVLDGATWRRFLPGPGGSGVLRVSAEIETASGVEHTARVEIRQRLGEGFLAGLSEQFGLPYVFGAGFLRRGELHGPDTGVGNDCANFLVYAWRRSGLRLPWCNPAQLRRHLVRLASGVRPIDGFRIPTGALERGLVIHLGSHVAALWKDREPFGRLGPDDLVIHHLGAAPEVLTLQELLSGRRQSFFDVYVGPARDPAIRIAVGGDVMPGDRGEPGVNLRNLLTKADLAVANLETTAGDGGSATPKRYTFRIASERLRDLRALGLRALNLANNHSGDFGLGGLEGTLEALRSQDLGWFGAGDSCASAVRAWRTQIQGVRVAFLGAFIAESSTPYGEALPEVSMLPRNEEGILEALNEARRDSDCVIVMPHWGDEGKEAVNEGQHQWARWFVQHGADAVVGSGPHVIQMREAVEGVPVFYSTGNLWFAGRWPVQSRQSGVALLGLDSDGRIVDASLVEAPESAPTSASK